MDIFENICRTCGNDCLEAMDIFEDTIKVLDNNLPISEMLSACLPAFASLPALSKDDDYPKQICRICIKKLTMIYEFNNKWITANNEFNVALKFEQRRNRARISVPFERIEINEAVKYSDDESEQPIETDTDSMKSENMLKHETIEGIELEPIICEPEEMNDEDLQTSIQIEFPPVETNYQCAICEERYHTLAAYKKHHKISHRNYQFLYYTPE